MALSTGLALAGGTVALAGFYWYGKKRLEDAREPPSVGRYPLVGSLYHLPEPLYLSIYERFGNEPVVRVHFGTQCVYVFNRWAEFKAAMVDNAEQLAGRLSQKLTARLFGETGGIVSSDGEVWREYRRFTLKTLRDFGFGRRGAEDIILTEADLLRRSIEEASGQPIETSLLLSTATSNIICQLVFGSRLASEDPRFAEILELFRKITHNSDSNATNAMFLSIIPVVENYPFLGNLLLRLPGSKDALDDFTLLLDYCKEQRDRHAAEMEGVDRARDYIEAHLLHQRNQPEMFTDTRLAMAVSDLFVAGTDTTANTLRWAILFMIANPDVAERVRAEIAGTIGRDRLPTMQDKAVMHYTQATIEEVHRKASLVPLGVFHRVIEDVTIEGVCTLKSDSICTFNVYAMHHDPQLFPNPEKFRPERHLTQDGQYQACPNLVAFGLGKRACLGESLARMELFIFFVALMQRYKFALDPEDSEKRTLWHLTEDPSFSKGTILRSPPLHKIVFSPY